MWRVDSILFLTHENDLKLLFYKFMSGYLYFPNNLKDHV